MQKRRWRKMSSCQELFETKLDEEHSEQSILKQSIKDLKHHSEKIKSKINALKKNLKTTEKEVLRLNANSNNLEDNLNNEKTKIASLILDKNYIEKENKRFKKTVTIPKEACDIIKSSNQYLLARHGHQVHQPCLLGHHGSVNQHILSNN